MPGIRARSSSNDRRQPRSSVLLSIVMLATTASPVSAQNWSFDARRIGLGGIGDTENIAWKMVEEQRGYRSIVIPLGLIQVLKDMSIFNPDDDAFDPVRAVEYAASPLHYTFGRDDNDAGQVFVNDLVNARLSRDLNTYRGFEPASELAAEGLASPNWGKTFIVHGARRDLFHGIYIGAGPYLSVRTNASIDPELTELLGSDSNRYIPNTRFDIRSTTAEQLALAITGGYRVRLALPDHTTTTASRDGIYVAANYNYLRGFRYDDFNLNVRLDTGPAGLLPPRPRTVPIEIERRMSSTGSGFALDFGAAVVIDRWDFGVGASGVANRIKWDEVEQELFVLQSVLDGGEFEEIEFPGLEDDRRVELPVTYSADVAYHADRWSAVSEYAHGFQGNNFHGGLEYRFSSVEVRGGGRYSRDRWHPSGGVGFTLSPGVGIDVAAFSTSANIERRRDLAVAISLRFNR